MKTEVATIPVVLFAYARPSHLRSVLDCLRVNEVPLIYAFSDAPKNENDKAAVEEVRDLLRQVEWCDVRLAERQSNMGLGRNVIAGISEVAESYPAFVVWEDDLVCVHGTYRWLCAALRHYADAATVGSVTAWTHPKIIPVHSDKRGYFDGRAECWVWGAWSRSWKGMEDESAIEKMKIAERNGIEPKAYGADLPEMARRETNKNIWAVRWVYHHLEHKLLCLRPPWSMVEHIGFGVGATNAIDDTWANPSLKPTSLPEEWPAPVENPWCSRLWREVAPKTSIWKRLVTRLSRDRA